MNLLSLLTEVVETTKFDYTEFFIIVGSVFGIVIICAIVLFWHFRYLKKKDKTETN